MKRGVAIFFSKGRGVLALSLAILLSGCDQTASQPNVPETEDPLYKQAQALRETNPLGAREKFMQVIDARGRDNAPESHLEAGRICLEHREPLEAIFHFKQFIRLRPSAPQVSQVHDLINTAYKVFLQDLPGRPFSEQIARDDNLDHLRQLRTENDTLKQRNTALELRVAELERKSSVLRVQAAQQATSPATTIDPVSLMPAQPPPPADAQATSIPKTHTVVKGDTLSSISLKHYGSRNRWREIYDANRDKMRSDRDLQIGMVLTIPR